MIIFSSSFKVLMRKRLDDMIDKRVHRLSDGTGEEIEYDIGIAKEAS